MSNTERAGDGRGGREMRVKLMNVGDYEQETGRKLTRSLAVDAMSWAAKVVKVDGGYIGFETWPEDSEEVEKNRE